MSQQPESTSPTLAANPAPGSRSAALPGQVLAQAAPPQPVPAPQRIPRWLTRIELFLRLMLRMYIGIALVCAPWSHAFWDQNPLFLHFPTLAIYAANGAVRGIVSGLGLLNLWIAFQDAIRRGD